MEGKERIKGDRKRGTGKGTWESARQGKVTANWERKEEEKEIEKKKKWGKRKEEGEKEMGKKRWNKKEEWGEKGRGKRRERGVKEDEERYIGGKKQRKGVGKGNRKGKKR